MAKRTSSHKPATARATHGAKPVAKRNTTTAKKAVTKVAAKLDPTKPTASRAQSDKSSRRPALKAQVRSAQLGQLAACTVPSQGELGIVAGGDNQMHLEWQVLK